MLLVNLVPVGWVSYIPTVLHLSLQNYEVNESKGSSSKLTHGLNQHLQIRLMVCRIASRMHSVRSSFCFCINVNINYKTVPSQEIYRVESASNILTYLMWHLIADVDATCSDFDFGTALHIAAFNLCTGAVKCLLEHGANPAFRVRC